MKKKNPDLLDYVAWRGDLTFSQAPFNAVDALIFSQLTYINFKGMLADSFKEQVSLSYVNNIFKASSEYEKRCHIGAMINGRDIELLNLCAQSNRFKNVMVSGYEVEFNHDKNEQFGAMCFSFEKSNIIAFEGTDDSFLGWQEDCDLACNIVIASQKKGLEYLDKAAKSLKGQFYLTGHSKGGSVALYAAVTSPKKIRKRIAGIYDYDGPGFPEEFFKKDEFFEIEDRLHVFYPQYSMVGMIFEHQKNYDIVMSSEFAVMQHDPFSWYVCGDHFEYVNSFTNESKFFRATINSWISSIDDADKKAFFDTLFTVVYAGEVETITELEENRLKCAKKILSAYAELSPDTKKKIQTFLRLIVKVGKENLPLLDIFGGKKIKLL